jgi:polysaccharide chain length determinant protein (PEP-CTERM system associated)
MQDDILTTEPTKPIDVARLRDLVKRRHLHFLLPFFFGWLLVWTASWLMPVHYKSTTTILVQQPSVPKDYVAPNISVDLQARLASLTQQILSSTRLLLIANRLHLYQSSSHGYTSDEIVKRMRKDIDISLVRDSVSGSISGFTVSYSAPSPQLAQQVTTSLTNLFITDNQHTLQQESQDTTAFLQQQLTAAQADLSKQDIRVKEFQTAHEGELPSQEASNLQILSGLQSQLQNDEDALNTASQQRVYFQSLIEQYLSLRADGEGQNSAPSSLDTINNQLTAMKSQLADLETRYTNRYPEVQDLRNKIAIATEERNQLTAAIQAHSASSHQGTTPGAAGLTTPIAGPAVLQLRSQLQATKAEILNRERDISELKKRIAIYQDRLNKEPAAQAQLANLTRGYEQSQANYNDLLKKEHNSAMATRMEQMQQGERFSVLDPPSLPERPDSPNRVKLSAIGLAFGLFLGALVAGWLEFLDDRLHMDKDIETLLPAAIIGEIPEISGPSEQMRTRRTLILGWAITALVILTIVAGSAFNYMYANGSSLHLAALVHTLHV